MSGFTLDDVTTTGSPTLGDLVANAGGDVYTLNVYPTVQGAITVDVDAGVVTDDGGCPLPL